MFADATGSAWSLVVRRTVGNLVLATLGLGAWSVTVAAGDQATVGAVRPDLARPTRAAVLVERHACWTGAAPHGVVPTRAVVTRPGERARIVPARVGFDIWLDGRPGVLHAFCR
ncbi:hypothetical protein ACT8ZV_08715 [Nocardioides sp. MAHUQ-72]|uniref:hypothetical protein n=1 Tax=unclassified Nocardioides TaxID=2615069 RepID=UPI00361A0F21